MQVDTSTLEQTESTHSDSTPTNNQIEQSAPEISKVKKWGSLVVLSLALAIIIIDTTLLNVSLGNIIRDLKTDIQSMQWVITGYALILAAFTITGGRMGDFFGRKKMFMVGAVVFAIGSYIASISKNVGVLIIGESVVEGIGAVLMMPATASLLVANFRGRERAIAFGVWGGIAAAASAIGPILGGYLTTNYSWRWGFRINIFVVALLLIGSVLISESRDSIVKKKISSLDFVGVFLSALGLLSVVFGFIKASDYGWFKAREQLVVFGHSINFGSLSVTPLFVLLGFIIIGLFVSWEKRVEDKGREPLVSLSLFRNRQFTSGTVTTGVLTLAMTGIIFTLPVFLQGVRQYTAFRTGLALLPLSITLLIVSPLGAFLSKKVSPKLLIQIGLLLDFIALIVLRQSLKVDVTALGLAPGLSLYGVGMGLVMSQVNNLTLSAVPVRMAGEASGVNNTFRQLGSTLGSAIIGAILLTSLSSNVVSGIQKSSVIPEGSKNFLSESVSKQTSSVEFGGGAQFGTRLSPEVASEIKTISNKATTDADKTAMAYSSIFAILGLLVSTQLPKGQIEDHHEDRPSAKTPKPEPSKSATPKQAEPEAAASKAESTVATAVEKVAEKIEQKKEEVKQEHIHTMTKTVSEAEDINDPAPDRQVRKTPFVILALLVIAALAYGGYKLFKKDNKTSDSASSSSTTEQQSSDQQTYNYQPVLGDKNNQSANQNAPQVAGVQEVAPVQNQNSASTNANTAGTTGTSATNSGSTNSGNTQTAPVAQAREYSSPAGFKFTMPSTVVAGTNNSENQIAFYNAQSGQPFGLVEVYAITDNSTLETIYNQLSQSPDIYNIQQTTFGGQPALRYTAYSTGQSTIVVLRNAKIYYINGGLMNGTIGTSFRFI